MKRKKIWISVIASMLIGTVSVAASSGIELHEFFNEKGEKVIYPWESIENPDLNYKVLRIRYMLDRLFRRKMDRKK